MGKAAPRKKVTSPSKTLAKLSLVNGGATEIGGGETAWERTNAYNLLHTGRFVSTPRHYIDLLRPLIEFFVMAAGTQDNNTNSSSSTATTVDAGGVHEAEGSIQKQQQRHQVQLRALSVFIFSNGISSYFNHTPLLSLSETPCLLATPKNETRENEEGKSEEARVGKTVTEAAKSNSKCLSGTQKEEKGTSSTLHRRKRMRSQDAVGVELASSATVGEDDHHNGTSATVKKVSNGARTGPVVTTTTTAPTVRLHRDFCELDVESVSGGDVPTEALRLASLLIAAGEHYRASFADDSAYLMAREACHVQKQWTNSACDMSIANSLSQLVRESKLDLLVQCLPCMRLIHEVMERHVESCMQRMVPFAPRVVRVCKRLSLTEKESSALTYLLLCHCGTRLPLTTNAALSPAALAYHNQLSPRELFSFLNEHRKHMKQGLFSYDAKYRPNFMECKLSMPQETIAALAGDELSEEQLIKLEKTALVEILNEERRHKQKTRMAAAAAVAKQQQQPGDEEEANPALPHVEEREEEEDSQGSTPVAMSLRDVVEHLEVDPELLEQLGGIDKVVAAMRQGELPPGISIVAEDATADGNEASTNVTGDQAEGGSMITADAAASSAVEASARMDDAHSLNQSGSGSTTRTPYTTDIEYMEEAFKVLSNIVKIRNAEGDMKDNDDLTYTPKDKLAATLRELKGKVRVSSAVHGGRVEATLREGKFVPRIEQLSRRLNLSELEKQILLLMVGNVVSHDILIAINGRYVMREGQRAMTVGYILFVLCESLQERVASRRAFYRSSPLVSDGVLTLTLESSDRSCFNADLMEYLCDIDRKIVDYLMGTETETSELVPGSSLVMPLVPMSNVILPAQTTDLVLSTIEQYSIFERCRKSCGFGEGLGDSCKGLVILFYGPSGTGKTMLANAVAHDLKKRLLVVNVAQFRSDTKAPEMMRFIFREAKLNDAIIFFDECEGLFETRETNPRVTTILAEFEKYDGLIIMATNAAQNMDEAMNRRISLMIEFKLPDHQMRKRIWQAHIPAALPLAEDVCTENLALNYELSGGLIRNAVLAGIHRAVAREKCERPTLRMEDFENGARQQLRGFFLAAAKPKGGLSSQRYVTPRHSLQDLVVEPGTRRKITAIAKVAKSRSTLFSQWGFSEELYEDQGLMCLFTGHSGTGKTLAAECIAYECGVTIRVCNVAELLLVPEANVATVFEEGRKLGAIIVFDEAQVLFNHSDTSIQIAQLIQYHAVTYPRPIIVIATIGGDSGLTSVDPRAARLVFTHEVAFQLPGRALRAELWRKAFPDKVPLAPDVDFDVLSETAVSAKLIRTAAFTACCQAALLPEPERVLTMKAIKTELENIVIRERGRNPSAGMFC